MLKDTGLQAMRENYDRSLSPYKSQHRRIRNSVLNMQESTQDIRCIENGDEHTDFPSSPIRHYSPLDRSVANRRLGQSSHSFQRASRRSMTTQQSHHRNSRNQSFTKSASSFNFSRRILGSSVQDSKVNLNRMSNNKSLSSSTKLHNQRRMAKGSPTNPLIRASRTGLSSAKKPTLNPSPSLSFRKNKNGLAAKHAKPRRSLMSRQRTVQPKRMLTERDRKLYLEETEQLEQKRLEARAVENERFVKDLRSSLEMPVGNLHNNVMVHSEDQHLTTHPRFENCPESSDIVMTDSDGVWHGNDAVATPTIPNDSPQIRIASFSFSAEKRGQEKNPSKQPFIDNIALRAESAKKESPPEKFEGSNTLEIVKNSPKKRKANKHSVHQSIREFSRDMSAEIQRTMGECVGTNVEKDADVSSDASSESDIMRVGNENRRTLGKSVAGTIKGTRREADKIDSRFIDNNDDALKAENENSVVEQELSEIGSTVFSPQKLFNTDDPGANPFRYPREALGLI